MPYQHVTLADLQVSRKESGPIWSDPVADLARTMTLLPGDLDVDLRGGELEGRLSISLESRFQGLGNRFDCLQRRVADLDTKVANLRLDVMAEIAGLRVSMTWMTEQLQVWLV